MTPQPNKKFSFKNILSNIQIPHAIFHVTKWNKLILLERGNYCIHAYFSSIQHKILIPYKVVDESS